MNRIRETEKIGKNKTFGERARTAGTLMRDFLKSSYYVRRILPFAVVFFGMEALEVAATFFWDIEKVDTDAGMLAHSFGSVFLQTSVAFLYAMIPYLAFLFFLPKRLHNGRADRIASLAFFSVFTLVCVFTEVSELFFWEEFRSRFNFIAVDYLVYTNEVVGNIWQSYPMVPILAGILVVAAIAGAFAWRRFSATIPAVPAWKTRGAVFAGAVALCAASFFCIDVSYAEGTGNRYNDELGKNGFYSLFSAFLKNELSYTGFYPTLPQNEVAEKIREEFTQENTRFLNPAGTDIRRRVFPRGAEKKLNVMFVVMESMSADFMNGNRADGKNLTPNLSALARDGLYFSSVYATGTRSVRGLEALSTALPPLPGMSVVRRDGNEGIETAGKIFADKGYKTRWIYGGYGVFDNMNYFFGNNGFEIRDRSSMNDDEISFTTIWGVCDEDLFRRAVREADESFGNGEPFFNFVFTTSNHRPYAYPDGKIDIPSKSGRLGAVKYADFAVGELMRLARERPWFDDTLFVFVADHCASSAGRRELNPEKHRIPLIFYAPKYIAPRRIDFLVSQIDVLPTLLGLLDFEYDCSFYGKDALAPDYRSRAFISNYQHIGFLDGNGLVVMKPVRETSVYRGESDVPETFKDTVPAAAERAVMYYQHAENWREFLKPPRETP